MADSIHDPGGLGYTIKKIWVVIDPHENDGTGDGIVASMSQFGVTTLMTAQEKSLPGLREAALKAARIGRKKLVIACFTVREDVEVIDKRPV